jgi:hypothetical protein
MIDDHDATKREFDAIVRDFAAEQVSRDTSNVTPPPTYEDQPDPLAAGRALVWGCSAALLIAIAVGAFLWPFLAAHV